MRDVERPAGRRIAGIDIGGTFTDLIIYDDDGAGPRVRVAKMPTTPENQADGVMAALAASGLSPDALDLIVHGTTATTNAVLERKIAKVGLITTAGFRDVLELGRRTRPNAYGMTGTFDPLIPRELRREVAERMLADGTVHTPLDEAAVAREAAQLQAAGCDSLVIHFLHSYANPAHEHRAGEIVRALWPNVALTLGAELLSEFREFERGTTAAVNAGVQPILARYITSLETRLADAGYARDLLIMNGNGGTVAAGLVAREAAKTVMSGPASGVVAAAATLAASGVSDAITCDMGGTSTDVALIRGGIPDVSSELSLGYGLPIHLPMVDVHTIGAGGGSIARIDAAGMLRVGPESAGARPGPIAFGRGGTRPTLTDANVILGRLPPSRLLAVEKPVPIDTLRAIFADAIARPLGLNVEAAAEAVVALANTHMAGAIRMVSLARGHDARNFALFAFGGAGPLHAGALAATLGMSDVIVPARPGLTNALGCLVADLRQDFVKSIAAPLETVDIAMIAATFADHEARGRAINGATGDVIVETIVQHAADLQFRGQTHLLRVALPSGTPTRDELQLLFEAAYFERFQVRLPEIKAHVVNLITSVIGRRQSIPLATLAGSARAASVAAAQAGERLMYAGGQWHATPVFDRDRLPLGAQLKGPAILEQLDATTIIEPGDGASLDALGNLRMTVGSTTRVSAAPATLDPLTLSVIDAGLRQVCNEMDLAFSRSAFSPVIAEADDRADGIYAASNGALVAQGDFGLPVFVGTMQTSAATLSHRIATGDTAPPEPGDIYIVNDPYLGGTHLMDVRFALPFYVDGRHIFWLQNTGHWPDVGGAVPGGFSAKATEVEQEGLRLPPVKLFKRGVLDQEILQIVQSNIRVADQRIGDIKAQVAALKVGERQLNALIAGHGWPTIQAAIRELEQRAETLMRAHIRAIPDGRFTSRAIVDSDGVVDEPLTIALTITKSGDTLTFDFAGSSPPCQGPMNSVMATTLSSVYLAVRHIFPDIPLNAGAFAPLTVTGLNGTFLDAHYPRPVSGCAAEVSQRIAEAVFLALVQAIPDKVTAAPAGTSGNFVLGGRDPNTGQGYVMYQLTGGGYGGNADHDGLTNGCSTIGISKTPPVEVLEQKFPVLFRRFALREGSAGQGRHRGGFGVHYEVELLRGAARAAFVMDHGRVGPPGALGGGDGAPNVVRVHRADGTYIPPHRSKDQDIALSAGDRVEVMTPGGGGYGDPADRDPTAIIRDRRRGYFGEGRS
jgi:N-methylhydantoinase A